MKNIKYRFLSLLLIFATLSVAANAAGNVAQRDIMCYVNNHYLSVASDGSVSVTALNLEWPALLNGSQAQPLQQELSHRLFGITANDGDNVYSLIKRYIASLGTRADSMPDVADGRRSYNDISLSCVGISEGRFITLRLSRQKHLGTGRTLFAKSEYLTYDIVDNVILDNDDILNSNLSSEDIYYLANAVLNNVPNVDNYNIEVTIPDVIGNPVLTPDALLFNVRLGDDHVVSSLPLPSILRYSPGVLSRSCRKLIRHKVEAAYDGGIALRKLLKASGDSVVQNPDSVASYPGGNRAQMKYLSENINVSGVAIPSDGATVVTAFIVEADGSLTHLMTVTPTPIGLNRIVVKAIASMDRWHPARNADGKAVRSLLFLPVRFKMQ